MGLARAAGGNTHAMWHLNNTDSLGVAGTFTGQWVVKQDLTSPAFRINGTPRIGGKTSVVPLPLAAWGGLALLGALGITRGRARARAGRGGGGISG